MSWFKTGWSESNEEGAKSPFESKGPRRFWIPPEKTARVLFLEDEPTGIWEHGFQIRGKWGNFEPCHTKNKISDRCPPCDSGDKMFPRFSGLFSMINMTPWFTKKDNREINFQREVFAANIGSKDKPGILKKIERLKQAEGRLRGCVFEVYRSGAKTESCGDEFKLVEKIDVDKIESYGREKLAAFVKRVNEKLPAKDHVAVDKLWAKNPWQPINFEKLFETDWKPRSLADLDRLFGVGGSASNSKSDTGKDDGDPGPSDDDDIPY